MKFGKSILKLVYFTRHLFNINLTQDSATWARKGSRFLKYPVLLLPYLFQCWSSPSTSPWSLSHWIVSSSSCWTSTTPNTATSSKLVTLFDSPGCLACCCSSSLLVCTVCEQQQQHHCYRTTGIPRWTRLLRLDSLPHRLWFLIRV